MTLTYTDRLVWLVGEVAAAATRLAMAPASAREGLVPRARRDAARLSARLDASPLEDATADEVDRAERDPAAATAPAGDAGDADPAAAVARVEQAAGGWATALRLDGMPTQEVAAVEYANLLAAYDAEPELAGGLFESPLETLVSLHGILCRGLVDPEVVGRPRRTVQAIHDGAQGWVIFEPADPDDVEELLDGLCSWLGRRSVAQPAVVVAGTVQERLLQWQPFEAANGRLARAASRLVLRARGVDPDGVAVPERLHATDPTGYHAEVAATIRRRGDLGLWLERYAEALASELTAVAEAVAPREEAQPPVRGLRLVEERRAGEAVTVVEYAKTMGTSSETARAELDVLARAGRLRVEPATRGLRYRVT